MDSHNQTTDHLGSGLMSRALDSYITYAIITFLAMIISWSQFNQPQDLLNPRKTFEFSNIPRLRRYMENRQSLDTLAPELGDLLESLIDCLSSGES